MKSLFLNLRTVICVPLVTGLLFSSCAKEQAVQEDIYNTRGIAAAANNNFNLTLFALALKATGQLPALSQQGPFTVFAPSNTAFIAAGISSESISRGTAAGLPAVIAYHIYDKGLTLDSIRVGFNQELKMAGGAPLYISHWQNARDTAFTVNGVRIEQEGLATTNGFIYLLDKMLRPTSVNKVQEVIANDANLTFFNAALLRSGLADLLNTNDVYTVFAASNGAFINSGITSTDSIYKMDPVLLQQLLKAHIAGGRSFINDYVARADIATNQYTASMKDGADLEIRLIPDPRPHRFRSINLTKETQPGMFTTATVVSENLTAKNGVVHIIDKLFIP